MKKRCLFLVLLLALLLTGCRRTEPQPEVIDPPAPPQVEQEEPVETLTELRIEITRDGLTTEQLTAAVRELPRALEEYLTEETEIETVSVTVGASHAATAQTLAAGNVDIAFLPAEALLRYGEGAQAVLGELDVNSNLSVMVAGREMLLCAAPTEYGTQLANRASSGKPLSWAEVSNACWGVLEETSVYGYGSLDLWLAENYDGLRVRNLPAVSEYADWDSLLNAAAAGEVDAFVIPEGQQGGFAVLDAAERLHETVAAAAPRAELTDREFVFSLHRALERLARERHDLSLLLGAERFAPMEDSQLDAMRRLINLGE